MLALFLQLIATILASLSLAVRVAAPIATPHASPTPTTQVASQPKHVTPQPKIRCTNAAMAAGECGTPQEQAQARKELAAPGSPEANQNQQPSEPVPPSSSPCNPQIGGLFNNRFCVK